MSLSYKSIRRRNSRERLYVWSQHASVRYIDSRDFCLGLSLYRRVFFESLTDIEDIGGLYAGHISAALVDLVDSMVGGPLNS